MGLPVLILGESGTGKSASLRNFGSDDLIVINVANKPLPFKNKIKNIATDDYREIISTLKNNNKKIVVIDDAQYLMANEFMRRAREKGFDKFTEIAQNFWLLVDMVKSLPQDQIVYFMAHIERDQNGNEKIKTIGKLLDEKITVEGMFTIVLKTCVADGVYTFLTQNSGHDTVKSPIGMFSSYAIDNDLKYVDEKIRNYYEIGDHLSDEQMAKEDEKVKNEDITPPERKKRRPRGEKEEKVEEKPEESPVETPRRKRRGSEPAVSNEGLPFDIPNTDLPVPDQEEEGPTEVEPNTGEVMEAPKRRRRRDQ